MSSTRSSSRRSTSSGTTRLCAPAPHQPRTSPAPAHGLPSSTAHLCAQHSTCLSSTAPLSRAAVHVGRDQGEGLTLTPNPNPNPNSNQYTSAETKEKVLRALAASGLPFAMLLPISVLHVAFVRDILDMSQAGRRQP